MDVESCLRGRRSVRAFKPELVPRAVLEEVLELASWSPSYKNTQPWEVIVLSGTRKEALSREMIRLFEGGAPANRFRTDRAPVAEFVRWLE